ncbi:MAG: F0F1 ATP synthase subunit delta [Candidatus Pacebacteria bacterium]|nr:F0F1 ATP synthase subunit delta [Candidatus Paceibacterota bacterium]
MSSSKSVVVESVIPLSAEQKRVLSSLLKARVGSEKFTEKVNPTLLGGLRVSIGTTQYDMSLTGKLSQLRNI